jgi:hypothetical protein
VEVSQYQWLALTPRQEMKYKRQPAGVQEPATRHAVRGQRRRPYHPAINGRAESFPVACHGEGKDVRKEYLADIISRFKLPKDFFD